MATTTPPTATLIVAAEQTNLNFFTVRGDGGSWTYTRSGGADGGSTPDVVCVYSPGGRLAPVLAAGPLVGPPATIVVLIQPTPSNPPSPPSKPGEGLFVYNRAP